MKKYIFAIIILVVMLLVCVVNFPNVNEILNENFFVIVFLFSIAHFLKLNVTSKITVVGDIGAYLMAIFTLSFRAALLSIFLFSLISFISDSKIYFRKKQVADFSHLLKGLTILYIIYIAIYVLNEKMAISNLALKYVLIFLISEMFIAIPYVIQTVLMAKAPGMEIKEDLKYCLLVDLFFATFFFPFIYFYKINNYEIYNLYLINVIIFYFIIYYLVKDMWIHIDYLLSLIRLQEFANFLSNKKERIDMFPEIKKFVGNFLQGKTIKIIPVNTFIPPKEDKNVWNLEIEGEYLSKLFIGEPSGGEIDIYSGTKIVEREQILIGLLIKQVETITRHKIVNDRVRHDFFAILESLIDLIEAKDPYSAGHSKRVSYYAEKIAEVVSPENKTRVRLSALLHDIGKLKIPKEILVKRGKLTVHEYELIKMHPVYGFEMLINLKGLDDILDGVLYHHERLDGSGYPYGVTGASIPAIARIINVADMYDAMTSDRPYRKRMTDEQCFSILEEEGRNNKIDLEIVKVLKNIIKERKNEKL
ncbi:MAG: HD domain-containing protein [Proteobacteria bacterium]|nr:HD domain-containing protein [Pseudomonadota bacterium]